MPFAVFACVPATGRYSCCVKPNIDASSGQTAVTRFRLPFATEYVLPRFIAEGEQAQRGLAERLAGRGEPDPSLGAVEQVDADVMFEPEGRRASLLASANRLRVLFLRRLPLAHLTLNRTGAVIVLLTPGGGTGDVRRTKGQDLIVEGWIAGGACDRDGADIAAVFDGEADMDGAALAASVRMAGYFLRRSRCAISRDCHRAGVIEDTPDAD